MTTTWDDLARAIDTASAEATLFKGEYDTLVYSNGVLTTQVRQLRASLKARDTRIAELEAQLGLQRCEFPVWQTAVPRGVAWQKPGDINVHVLNEVWNTAEAGPQTLKVCNASSWYAEANHPKAGVPADREGSVKSYPCTQVLFSKPALNSITSLTSKWAHEAPDEGYWNACYDIWLGGLGSASTAEVMIWTDKRYPGPIPPSNAVKTDTVTLGGRTYVAWTRKNSNGGDYIALVDKQDRPRGDVNLLLIFQYLVSLGWIKSTDTLAAVNYGIEISSTKMKPATFYLNDFKLEHNGKQLV